MYMPSLYPNNDNINPLHHTYLRRHFPHRRNLHHPHNGTRHQSIFHHQVSPPDLTLQFLPSF